MDFYTSISDNSIDFGCPPTSGISTCHRPQHALKWQYWPQTQKGLWQQLSPWISAWLQAAAQTTGIHMAFNGNRGHQHQHRPQLQKNSSPRQGSWQQRGSECHHGLSGRGRSFTSVWPMEAAWPTDTNTASGCSTAHRLLCGYCW